MLSSFITVLITSFVFQGFKYKIFCIELLFMMLSTLFLTNFGLFQGFILLKKMYSYHRLEFYNHRNALVTLLLTTWISLILL